MQEELVQKGSDSALLAIKFDQEGRLKPALSLYSQTRAYLAEAASLETDEEAKLTIEDKIRSFARRIEELVPLVEAEEAGEEEEDGGYEREEIDEEALSDSRDSSYNNNSSILEPPQWSNELVGGEDLIEKHNLESQIKNAKKRAETFTKSLGACL